MKWNSTLKGFVICITDHRFSPEYYGSVLYKAAVRKRINVFYTDKLHFKLL